MNNHDKKTILVVEDEIDVMDYLVTLLEDNGYNVITADNATAGFEMAKSKHPDLISLDISMPGESGVRLYSKLYQSKSTSDIPVFVVTGFSTEFKHFIDDLDTSVSPDAFFEKPIDRDLLIDKIREKIG